ncbi:hypothetical protein TNIN_429591, partial [Trichonephila inaurata madagascariensis]
MHLPKKSCIYAGSTSGKVPQKAFGFLQQNPATDANSVTSTSIWHLKRRSENSSIPARN